MYPNFNKIVFTVNSWHPPGEICCCKVLLLIKARHIDYGVDARMLLHGITYMYTVSWIMGIYKWLHALYVH